MSKKHLFELKDEDLRELLRHELKQILAGLKEALANQATDLDELISRQELADYFDVSLVTIDKWVYHKVIPAPFKLGNRVYFRKSEITELIGKKINLKNSPNHG
jgi:predicted DNA-binding transcriptional regulator AlpA